jgi:hypothetical protein
LSCTPRAPPGAPFQYSNLSPFRSNGCVESYTDYIYTPSDHAATLKFNLANEKRLLIYL